MTRGILIFAHNSIDVDYGLMSIIAGGLAKKHLNLPVSLVTDTSTLRWLDESGFIHKAKEVFDKVIEVERPYTTNKRKLHDGPEAKQIPFINTNRCSAYDLSPYDQTLLIDSDFLIFSDNLNQYWDIDASVMLGHSMNDIEGTRYGMLDKRISETGIHLFWATTVMFRKDEASKFFFSLVDFVKENYKFYADLFGFNPLHFRNDIAFSIAKHILNGFETDPVYTLPPIFTVQDKDLLIDVEKNKLVYLINNITDRDEFWAATTQGIDVHIMNKQSIIRNKNSLLELI